MLPCIPTSIQFRERKHVFSCAHFHFLLLDRLPYSLLIFKTYLIVHVSVISAGKGFVEAVKNKTEEELDEDVRMETENIKVWKNDKLPIYLAIPNSLL